MSGKRFAGPKPVAPRRDEDIEAGARDEAPEEERGDEERQPQLDDTSAPSG